MRDKIGVGIIGANPERGWAATAHIPALKSLPQYEIRALSTTRTDTARLASQKFGVALAFDNYQELVNHPDVDLVAVTVKVPQHRELVTAALRARKHVYCEWPLGNGLAEAEELAALAKEVNVHAVAGLQARFSPTVQFVRHLVASGYVGRVLSTSVIASGMAWSGVSPATDAYVNDVRNGATLLTIPLGHMIDALCWTLGEFRTLTAAMANHLLEATIVETGAKMPKTAEDQVVIAGELESDITVSVHYRAGKSRGTNFHWEINGTDGDLVMNGPVGHLQFMEPQLRGATRGDKTLADLQIPAEYRPANMPTGPGFNVAQAYARLSADIEQGTHTMVTFDQAVTRHRMLQAVQSAAKTGQRQILGSNPT
jgi:predicted dehydrogenase